MKVKTKQDNNDLQGKLETSGMPAPLHTPKGVHLPKP